VGEATAEVVAGLFAGKAGEDLGFPGEAPEGLGVEDAGAITSEGRAIRVRRLGVSAAGEFAALRHGECGG